MAGRQPGEYDLEPYDVTNEHGGSQSQSQTNTAKVYTFESLNGIKITVLDTPGLADTRGLQKDKEHKDSIAAAIRDNIPEVTAVIILANGTNPRLGVATDYAITTLTSIFPNTLAVSISSSSTNNLFTEFSTDRITSVSCSPMLRALFPGTSNPTPFQPNCGSLGGSS